jgi:hypothetical protein
MGEHMKILVGYTGFVGSNLNIQTHFNGCFNSQNIQSAFGLKPDLLVYCGVRAEKYLANQNPEKDLAHINEAMANIHAIAPKKLVLISTIDIYANPQDVDEATQPALQDFMDNAYGKHRLLLENHVREHFDTLIVRLPALFGRGLKKNFIYDLYHPFPSKLTRALYTQFASTSEAISAAYTLDDATGFYAINDQYDYVTLLEAFEKQQFSSLNFTDSRAVFQFYPLSRLWQDIEIALHAQLEIINLATEPVSAAEVYAKIYGGIYLNEKNGPAPYYDFHSQYAHYFKAFEGSSIMNASKSPYLMTKEEVLESIKAFLRGGR